MQVLFIIILSFIVHFSVAQSQVNYLESPFDFANPERGFYRYSVTYASNYIPLNQQTLEQYREAHTPWGANYTIHSTLVFRYFILDSFLTSIISNDFLNNIQTDFNTARNAGIKLIPRFAYTNQVNNNGCSSWICPPYGDASKSWVLTHIDQLKPILTANHDVIAIMQMGFIGVWGENYYTDHFGDASQPPDYKLSDNDWSNRIEVLDSLLSALPDNRMIQVRYPQMKQRSVYGINSSNNAPPLQNSEAYNGSKKSRIGFHNDCLLASFNDYGTYNDYGNSNNPSFSDTAALKPYFAADSRFVGVGGETCDDNYSPQNDCSLTDPTAYAELELERMHYSYLNAQYDNDVNNDWVTGGCMEDIKKRLGYRFSLQHGNFSSSTQAGQIVDLSFSIKNKGYTAPFNARNIEFILRDSLGQEEWVAPVPADPRFWLPGDSVYTVSNSFCIPTTMPNGTYELLLNLNDPVASLSEDPRYSIRLANLFADSSDIWDSINGYNKLGHYLVVDNNANNAFCNGEISFENTNSTLPVQVKDVHNEIEIGPNPCSDFIRIHYGRINKTMIQSVELYSMDGKVRYVHQGPVNNINLEAFHSGIYVLLFKMQSVCKAIKFIKN